MSISTEYYIYTTSGHETLPGICNTNQCKISEVIRINTQPYSQTQTVGQLLTSYQVSGKILPEGLKIRVPYAITGGKDTYQKKYNILTDSKLRQLSSSVKDSWKQFNCFVTVYRDRKLVDTKYLPIYPNEFSDTNNANFNGVNLFGRSVDYQIYQGSSREISVTLQMHEELCSNVNYIHQLVAFIESANYPGYRGTTVEVPEIRLTVGRQFQIRGILTSCSANWKAPIIDGRLVNCDLALGIKETTGPYSMADIRSKGGYR